ncbi:hypothetical protein [Mycobacteroides abscessus]|uniref:hypothetical protein n=1 Tax=Mycobacteroides abscessus TaxID=36809 RepID=UPI00092BA65B|nr:hypothetical protein [Mycobacteroides abscessus]SHQ27437.1 Uncharacterised protein [Mycobacteroides abscessus subsp. abscessus]SHQ33317.1 Uncharacterised protein [Mycobacteroides abscessus subsp. abscessus]SHQ42722.1 Uncharacterised protein [Mycobacteroides abscessus subsp. abscessus]SHQ62274.1 Uncharacterised protein [Mycobacteroides abscessus subsp. abscessus]SHR24091.1 Uncharacterised protein [Mycobacteroides abscessus subsp. abscessus]
MDKTGWNQVLQQLNSDTEAPATDLLRRLRGDETETASADSEELKHLYARLATPAPQPESSNYVPGEGGYTRPPKHPHQDTIDFLREAVTGEIAQTIY